MALQYTKIEPSLPKESKPNGQYSPPNNRGLTRQNETADLFSREGYNVQMLEEIDGGNGYGLKPNSNPDYLIEGEAFDCYSPEANTSIKNIVNAV